MTVERVTRVARNEGTISEIVYHTSQIWLSSSGYICRRYILWYFYSSTHTHL